MSFAGTPLGQSRRLDHHTFLNKPHSNSNNNNNNNNPPLSPQRSVPTSYAYGAPSLGTRSPPKPSSSSDDPALVRYARLKQRDQNIASSSSTLGLRSPPKPEKWSVKDTTVNIANAFHLAAEDMQPAAPNPNNSWASGSRSAATLPRSTSVEYEKETQSITNRRFPPPPNRLAPPSRSNGAGRKPLSKQKSVHHVPDSEGEDAAPANRIERGKSPLEHVVDMTRRAFAPATIYLRQRSQEPSADAPTATNGHNSSYDYSAEEREYQAQKPSSRVTHHKKGRMSLDNKAYRPSASDLDEDSEEDDDGKKVRRRKSKKKEPHGGPLTTLPVANYEKKRRRKSKGSKGNSLEMEDDESTGLSDEHHSEQQRTSAPPPNSRASQTRASVPLPDDSGRADSSMDIEQGLDSIPEMNEAPTIEDQYPSDPVRRSHSFSIGDHLGRLVHLIWRAVAGLLTLSFGFLSMTFMLIGRVFGTVFDVLFNQPSRWVSHANPGPFVQLAKYIILGLTVYAAWYTLQDQTFSQWIPSRSPASYHAPDIPAANIAELSARLQSIENVLSGLSVDHERSRSRLEHEVKSHADLVGRLGSLESRIQQEKTRALEAEQQYRTSTSQGLQAVRHEVEILHAQLHAQSSAHGANEGNDEEARAKLRALEERVGSVEGGVKEALEVGKHSAKTAAGVGSSTAWWSKLTAGRSGLTIKSSDGQDVTSLIGHLVDSAVSQYGKDNLARPDFALHSSGAKTIPSLTTETFEIRPQTLPSQLLGLVTGNGYAIGRPPVTALHHELHNGHCWPFAGSEGQLGVALSSPVYISDITIDHVAKEVAFDMRSAPRDMEVWGMVEGEDNIAKVKAWEAEKAAKRAEAKAAAEARGVPFVDDEMEVKYPGSLPKSRQYLRVASFTYDIHSSRNIQTFPADEEIRGLGVDFGIVVLMIKNNWGQDAFTCLYRFRVHGERMGETSPPYPEEPA